MSKKIEVLRKIGRNQEIIVKYFKGIEAHEEGTIVVSGDNFKN